MPAEIRTAHQAFSPRIIRSNPSFCTGTTIVSGSRIFFFITAVIDHETTGVADFGGSVCIKQNINRSIHPGVQHRRAHISYIQRQKPRYPKSFGRQIVHRLAESVPTLCKEKAPGQIRRNLPPRLSDFAIAMPKVRLRTPKSLPEIADCGVEIKRGH